MKNLFIIIIVLFVGCREVVNENIRNTQQYFDLKGLLDEQIVLLDSLHPTLNKTTRIDGDEESLSLQLDSSGWAREMEIFFDVDINEPILRDAYLRKDENLGDSLRLESYEAKAGKNAEIEYLKIFYNRDSDVPQRITAVFTEKNALYDSKRLLKLEFDQRRDLNILSGYSIEGVQKMLLKDSIYYEIEVVNSFKDR